MRAKGARIRQQLHPMVLHDHLVHASLLCPHHMLHQNYHVHVVQGAAFGEDPLVQRSRPRLASPQAQGHANCHIPNAHLHLPLVPGALSGHLVSPRQELSQELTLVLVQARRAHHDLRELVGQPAHIRLLQRVVSPLARALHAQVPVQEEADDRDRRPWQSFQAGRRLRQRGNN